MPLNASVSLTFPPQTRMFRSRTKSISAGEVSVFLLKGDDREFKETSIEHLFRTC